MNDDRILDAEILAAIAANMGLQPVRDIVASHEALRARLADTPELWSCPDCAFTYDAIHVDDATGEHVCPVCREIELERRLADTEAERDALNRRLFPDQGHGYANEVERQRVVIYELTRIATAAEARAERAEAALRTIADPENYHNDDWGVEVMYGTREIARAALGEQER